MITFHQIKNLLQITLSGECNFAIARELLLKCKIRLHESKITRIEINLREVTSFDTCMLGSLLVLAELAGGKMQVNIKNCSPDIHSLFESNLLPRSLNSHFSHPSQHTSCSQCLQDNCDPHMTPCIKPLMRQYD